MKPEEKPKEPLKTRCGTCGGRDVGVISGEGWIPCPTCKPLKTPCRVCKGTGQSWIGDGIMIALRCQCPTCKGTGYEENP
jgi:hypothetical protein